ncbi:MAG: Acb2/Tad1 domain-containing protein [Serratia proteamaculans]
MENQHRKISGYRELSQEEIDLMNRIKAKGAELLALQVELAGRLSTDYEVKLANACDAQHGTGFDVYQGSSDEAQEFRRFMAAESTRWAAIGKTDIQTGIMALVRAVAQPIGC